MPSSERQVVAQRLAHPLSRPCRPEGSMMRDYRELKTEPRATTRARLPRAALTACTLPLALLFVQFLLGMYLNLFVAHPKGAGLTSTHVAVGVAILLANLFA